MSLPSMETKGTSESTSQTTASSASSIAEKNASSVVTAENSTFMGLIDHYVFSFAPSPSPFVGVSQVSVAVDSHPLAAFLKGVLQQKARGESSSSQSDGKEAKSKASGVEGPFATQPQSSSSLNSSSSSDFSSSSYASVTPLTKEHTEEYAGGILQDLKFYVPSRVSVASLYSSTELLEDKIKHFLKSDKKVMLILGDSGTGKTLSSRYFAREIKKEYTQGSHQFNDYIPIYVPLNKNTALDSHIIEKVVGEKLLTKEETAELKKNKLLLFLDGYDEIRSTSNFYSDNQLEQYSFIKLIITCRSEYYTDTIGNHNRNFAPLHPDSGYVCEDKLDTWYMAPFTADEIENYVRGYLTYKTPKPEWRYEDWDSYRKEHSGSMNNSKVLSNPFVLSATMEIFGDIIKKKAAPEEKEVDAKETKEVKEIQKIGKNIEEKEITKFDCNEIYRRFITQWFSKQVNQLSKDTRVLLGKNEMASLWKHAKFLAMQLFFTAGGSKEIKISFEEEPELTALMESSFKRGSNEGDSQQESLSTLVLRCLLLHKISDSAYVFIHYSIMEYLAALKLIEEVKSLAFPNELDQKGYSDLVKNSICKKLFSSSYTFMQFFTSEMRKSKYAKIKNILFRIIRASRAIPKTVDSSLVSTGAANSISLLNAAGIDFNGLDLHGIRIPGANLSGGQFDRTDLQDADMREVNISGGWLKQSNLSRTNLTGLKLDELPKITFSGPVHACCYSPNFRYLAVAAACNIYLYDGLGRKLLHTFKGHTDSVEGVAFGPEGLLASGSRDGTVRLWNTEQKKPVYTFEGYTADVYSSVAFGPGGLLASGSWDQTVCLWDTEKKKLVHIFEGYTSFVESVAFGPGGLLASGSWDQTVCLWDAKQKKPVHTFKGHTGKVRSVAFGPGGLLASGSGDNTVRLWDTEQKKHLHTFKEHTSSVECVVFGRGGLLASGSGDKTVRLWDTKQKKPAHTFEGHTRSVTSVAFGPRGLLASGSWDQNVRLWNTEKKYLHTFEEHTDFIRSVAFGPGGLLATGSLDQTVRLWDVAQKKHLHTFDLHPNVVDSVAFGPGGLLASGSWVTVHLWDTKQKKHLHTFEGHTGLVCSVAFGPRGLLASASDDQTVRLWDTEQKKAVHIFKGHTSVAYSVAFGPGGILASGSWDNTVRLWDTKQKQLAHIFEGHVGYVLSIAFGPGGLLASGSGDKTVRLWDTKRKKHLHTFEGHTSWVYSVAFGPGGLLASGSGDKTVRLWDIQQKKCVSIITGFLGRVDSLSWLGTDKVLFLATGSDDYALRVWKITKLANNEFDITLFFASQPSVLNLHRTIIDGVIGLSDDNLQLFSQYEEKGMSAYAKTNTSEEKKEEMMEAYNLPISGMISAANPLEMKEANVSSSPMSSSSTPDLQVSTAALLQIGTFGSTRSSSAAAMSSSSSVSSYTNASVCVFI